MADNKKYYYMRLKENFFESEELIMLESMPDGILYSNILIKLYLKSLKNEGRLMFKETIPYNPQMIATITRHQIGTVEKALGIFEQLGLIDLLDNGAIYMNDIELFVGQASTEAERKKKARMAIEAEKKLMIGQMSDECPTNIHQSLELEKEIELKLEKDKQIDLNLYQEVYTEVSNKKEENSSSSKLDKIPYKEILSYLNDKVGKNFRHTTKSTQNHINARFKEGFTLEDFKVVIDKKTSQWLNDGNMSEYLRPETLFGTKFEGYLNESGKPRQPFNNRYNNQNYQQPVPQTYQSLEGMSREQIYNQGE